MNKNKISKIISVLVVFSVVSFLGCILYRISTSKLVRDTNWFRNKNLNTTKTVTKVSTSDNKPNAKKLSKEVEEKFKNDPEGFKIFKIGWGYEGVVTNEKWDFTKSPFVAVVTDYNEGDSAATLEFIKPNDSPYYETEKLVALPTDCDANNTFIVDSSTNVTTTDKNFLDEVKPGTIITSYCLDEECTQLHKLCKLHINVEEYPY